MQTTAPVQVSIAKELEEYTVELPTEEPTEENETEEVTEVTTEEVTESVTTEVTTEALTEEVTTAEGTTKEESEEELKQRRLAIINSLGQIDEEPGTPLDEDGMIGKMPDILTALLFNCQEYGVRCEASNNATIVVTIPTGAWVVLTGNSVENEEGQWLEVQVSWNGVSYTGYIENKYLIMNATQDDIYDIMATYSETDMVSGISMDAVSERLQENNQGFENSIAAFPESYKAYLRQLHALHPNWVFVAHNTNLSWKVFIDEEMVGNRCLVPKSMPVEYKQNDVGISGSGWVRASRPAVEYYADPRNFLTEESIYQFELLIHNSNYQNKKGVEKILSNTFMSNRVIPDDVISYTDAFMKIGKEINVSPYHLASRVRQEHGGDHLADPNNPPNPIELGLSPLISGNYPGYEGYYNYFNIKASGTTKEDIYRNGLEYAKSQGWNTRYRSLIGGGQYLGNYIGQGQNTVYLQKFDVDNSDGKLYCQYMQNLLAPCNEGNTTRRAYEELGVLNNAFVFRIPVYNNMPTLPSPKPGDSYIVPEKFILMCYKNLLGRTPNKAELAKKEEGVKAAKMSAAQIVITFIESKEFQNKYKTNEEYVSKLYTGLFGRKKADAEGVAFFTKELRNGLTRRYVLAQFVATNEFQKICNEYQIDKGFVPLTATVDLNPQTTMFVARMYAKVLKRTPDTAGVAFWVDSIVNKGETAARTAEFFITSDEYLKTNPSNDAYITTLYYTLMDRKPDSAGKNYWLKEFSSGLSRKYMLAQFVASKEFNGICDEYGMAVGRVQLKDGRDLYPAQAKFTYRLYDKVMNRKPDIGGLNYWATQLGTKKVTAYEASLYFLHSDEFLKKKTTNEQYVTILYRTFFGREPEKAGMNYWLKQLKNGKSRDYLAKQFAYSKEFQKIINEFGV